MRIAPKKATGNAGVSLRMSRTRRSRAAPSSRNTRPIAQTRLKRSICDPLVAEMDRRLFAPTGFEVGVNQGGRVVLFRYHRAPSKIPGYASLPACLTSINVRVIEVKHAGSDAYPGSIFILSGRR